MHGTKLDTEAARDKLIYQLTPPSSAGLHGAGGAASEPEEEEVPATVFVDLDELGLLNFDVEQGGNASGKTRDCSSRRAVGAARV